METTDAKDKKNNIFYIIYSTKKRLPKRQKDVAEYIINNSSEIPFLTTQELAERIGTSPSTVVRAIIRMGFKSFLALKDAVRDQVLETTASPLHRLCSSIDSSEEKCEEVLEKVVFSNAETIRSMLTPHLIRNFCMAGSILTKAKRIFVFGLRSSRGVAVYLQTLLHQCVPDVFLLDPCGSDDMVEHLLDLTPEDAFISIISAGPRYSKRSELALKYTHENGIPSILITNNLSILPASFADAVLIAPQHSHCYSVVTFMTLVDALVLHIGAEKKDRSKEKIAKAGPLLLDFKISM